MHDMQLSDVGDLPFHQAPTPFNVLATSDPHFNDGYYFATYAEDWYVSLGMRLHLNTNVVDDLSTLHAAASSVRGALHAPCGLTMPRFPSEHLVCRSQSA
ncbi:hypothetical protein [Alcaligenes aquatilis]|uniref:hypothetical protein n=1 Tax=Alcaligenes aquatilis TaxID=323284 RepID=UPI003D23FA7A